MNNVIAIWENSLFQNLLSSIVGGLIVFFVQRYLDNRKKRLEISEKTRVGTKKLYILEKDFLYAFVPGEVSFAKLVEEIGQPHHVFDFDDSFRCNVFDFINAKVQVVVGVDSLSVISITVFSKDNADYPINCRLSFEEDDQILGKALVSDIIIKDHFFYKVFFTQTGAETIIGCANSYRQTKHLKYYYQINGDYSSIENCKGVIINQVCVTQMMDQFSFFSFNEIFYP